MRYPARTAMSEFQRKVRRVYRGRYFVNRWHTKSLPARLGLSLLLLRPPVPAMRTIIRNQDTTPREKATVLGVLLRLRIDQWLQPVKIAVDGPLVV